MADSLSRNVVGSCVFFCMQRGLESVQGIVKQADVDKKVRKEKEERRGKDDGKRS